MRVVILAVGKLRQPGLREVMDDYLARIRRYAQCDEIEIKDSAGQDQAGRFEKLIPERARVVALEVGGKSFDSHGLARFVGRVREETGSLALLLGGADGLPARVSAAAHERWSLSALTLPHRLARVVVAEQIYRAFTILNDEPYSH